MLSFIVRRLLIAIPLVLLSSVLVFLLVANSGDPLADLKGRNPPVPPQVIQAREHQLLLDKPLPQRYWHWLTHFVRGDMGKSIRGVEVRPLLWQRIKVTLRMVVVASILAIVLAIGAGVLSAVKQYTVTDYTFTFAGFLFLSMPVFWLAALLKEYGAIRLNKLFGKQVVFTVGAETPNLTGSLGHRLADYAGHLVLPTIALALISFAAWSRYQRATMLDVLGSDYIRLARAKGLSRSRVMVRHALRNALIPLVTVVAIDTGALFSGAIITERVFSWQGMGALLVQGAETSDPNILLAWLMVTSFLVVLFNLIADVLYAVLDPRIRYG
jgi:peptide/nickel transport system permease protein